MLVLNVPKLKNPDIPFGNLYHRLVKKAPVNIYTGILTMLSPQERLHLYQLASTLPQHATVVEVGTYAGGSTYFLGKGVEQIQGTVTSIDPFASAQERQINEHDNSSFLQYMQFKPTLTSVRESLNRAGINGQVKLVEGFGEDVAKNWTGPRVNMLWIDGNHLNARKDFDCWERYLAPGAVVAFHDTDFPRKGKEAVTRDVRQLLSEMPHYNLQKADSITSFNVK